MLASVGAGLLPSGVVLVSSFESLAFVPVVVVSVVPSSPSLSLLSSFVTSPAPSPGAFGFAGCLGLSLGVIHLPVLLP